MHSYYRGAVRRRGYGPNSRVPRQSYLLARGHPLPAALALWRGLQGGDVHLGGGLMDQRLIKNDPCIVGLMKQNTCHGPNNVYRVLR